MSTDCLQICWSISQESTHLVHPHACRYEQTRAASRPRTVREEIGELLAPQRNSQQYLLSVLMRCAATAVCAAAFRKEANRAANNGKERKDLYTGMLCQPVSEGSCRQQKSHRTPELQGAVAISGRPGAIPLPHCCCCCCCCVQITGMAANTRAPAGTSLPSLGCCLCWCL